VRTMILSGMTIAAALVVADVEAAPLPTPVRVASIAITGDCDVPNAVHIDVVNDGAEIAHTSFVLGPVEVHQDVPAHGQRRFEMPTDIIVCSRKLQSFTVSGKMLGGLPFLQKTFTPSAIEFTPYSGAGPSGTTMSADVHARCGQPTIVVSRVAATTTAYSGDTTLGWGSLSHTFALSATPGGAPAEAKLVGPTLDCATAGASTAAFKFAPGTAGTIAPKRVVYTTP